MPGNLPELMGVPLLDRFAPGPSTAFTAAGFAYHFWAVPYGLAIGTGFLASPVVASLGVGPFGKDFGWHFAATVLTAHALYGVVLG